MLGEALQIAADSDGIVAGACAVGGLIDGFPCDVIDVFVSQIGSDIDQSVSRYTMEFFEIAERNVYVVSLYDGKIRVIQFDESDYTLQDVIDRLMSRSDFEINQCYYDQHGILHATDAARAAAASHVLRPTRPVRLDRVHKYQRLGFEVVSPIIDKRCKYTPELRHVLAEYPEITEIEFNDMVVDDDLMRDIHLNGRTYNMCHAVVTAQEVNIGNCQDTVFLGTRTTTLSYMLDNCRGYLIVRNDGTLRDCSPELYIEQITCGTASTPGDRCIVFEEKQERDKIRVAYLAGLDTVTDEQVAGLSARTDVPAGLLRTH